MSNTMNNRHSYGRALGWGYEGKSVEDLLEYCCSEDATVVVDVRLNAISRKKGFSKTALRSALENASISYFHLRQLGNPKDNRKGFWSPGTVAAVNAHRRFTEEILTSQAAQEQLELAEDLLIYHNVVFICFEHEQCTCHRELVIQEIEKRIRQNKGEGVSRNSLVVALAG